MKVFISWSGDKSKIVADYLHQWIPLVIQSVEPWMSAKDIDAGARWSRNVEQQLSDTRFGIICLTRSNTAAPWVLFETGALAKTIEETFVCPYLIDIMPSDIPAGPLTQFQAKKANETETWELILTINRALGSNALSDDQLKKTFEKWWPDLKQVLVGLPSEATSESPDRSPESKLDEILDTVRDLSRRAKRSTLFPPRKRASFVEDLRLGLEGAKSQEIRIEKMEKIEEYQILTERTEFTLEVFYDADRIQFVGHLTGFPAELPEVLPGQSYPTFKTMTIEPRDEAMADKNRLIEYFNSVISELDGKITSVTKL